MQLNFLYDRGVFPLTLPDSAHVYASSFPQPAAPDAELVARALDAPCGTPRFDELLARRRAGKVVIVVSDITRPIPYAAFLPQLLARIEAAGVPRRDMLLLVATGMHRASTTREHVEMFGADVAGQYAICDHRADDAAALAPLPGRSWSGAPIMLNRHLVEAGFRIATGLVEPHFMAGFSGGRKAICPGCASLDTVRNFHGAAFLSDARACNANLAGNPLHLEALSMAKALGVDFTINVVLNQERRVVKAFAGTLEAAHEAACAFVNSCACPPVPRPADVVLTSSGGYPLDATFYQCVKGFVSCLPAVKPRGTIIACGGCTEGIGSAAYTATMGAFSGRWRAFPAHIRGAGTFVKDQWQFQMHCRALAKVGTKHLHFVTAGLRTEELRTLSVTPCSVPRPAVQSTLQAMIDKAVAAGHSLAAFPDGPYCAPVSPPTEVTVL